MKRISEEDAELFRAAVRDVKPLAPGRACASGLKRCPAARVSRAPIARPCCSKAWKGPSTISPSRGAMSWCSGARACSRPWCATCAAVCTAWRPSSTCTATTSCRRRLRSQNFLNEALERDIRCVRIVHGKGLRSGHRGPVLKNVVSNVLRRIVTVVAFVSARPVDGGTGALYVLLSR